MKILVTGANGQVGSALTKALKEHEIVPLTRKDCDLTNLAQIHQVITQNQPELIINAAAYTKVDQAEEEKELAFQINCDAPRAISEKALEYDIPFIHFSTDYVFDGEKAGSYGENDLTNPINVYGQSKLAGEIAVKAGGGKYYIFRTSWVYSNTGDNFYLTIKNKCAKQIALKVVGDQFGVPTSSIFLAEQIKQLIPILSNNNIGTYNLVPDGISSWYEFAKAIIHKTNKKYMLKNLLKANSSDYLTNVNRPKNSRLNNEKIKRTFMLKFLHWDKELDKVINET
jgi:dTDP-4-dehydrorhamnose reductase